MNGSFGMHSLLYNLILHSLAAPALALYYAPQVILRGKYRQSLSGKLGCLPAGFVPEELPRPRIWFHAVSVGEVVALGPLVRQLRAIHPQGSVIISTGTETGQAKAASDIPDAAGLLYLPLDFPAFVNRVVRRIEPDLFVLMETELWPNLIHALKKGGAKIALANGRISDRSYPRYVRLRRFFEPVLAGIDLLLVTSEVDAERLAGMGAAADRIVVTGNTKFDAALGALPEGGEDRVRELLSIGSSDRVIVAGSTHPGEHELILDAYKELLSRFPDLLLIIVPRHVEKTPAVITAIEQRGLGPAFLRSAADHGETRDGRRIIVVDRTGELFQVYSVADVVFVGGSLVPLGGQNILEPAAWGKPILFGPSMEDFREAREILFAVGAATEVSGIQDSAQEAAALLANPQQSRERGMRGREAILKHVGSSRKTAEHLCRLLKT